MDGKNFSNAMTSSVSLNFLECLDFQRLPSTVSMTFQTSIRELSAFLLMYSSFIKLPGILIQHLVAFSSRGVLQEFLHIISVFRFFKCSPILLHINFSLVVNCKGTHSSACFPRSADCIRTQCSKPWYPCQDPWQVPC